HSWDHTIKFLPPALRPKAHFYGYKGHNPHVHWVFWCFLRLHPTVTLRLRLRRRSHLGLESSLPGLQFLSFPGRGYFKRHKRHKRHNPHEHWAFLPSEASHRSVTKVTKSQFPFLPPARRNYTVTRLQSSVYWVFLIFPRLQFDV